MIKVSKYREMTMGCVGMMRIFDQAPPSTVHQILFCWLFEQFYLGEEKRNSLMLLFESFSAFFSRLIPKPWNKRISSHSPRHPPDHHPHLKSHHTFKSEDSSCGTLLESVLKKRQWIYIWSGSCRRDSFLSSVLLRRKCYTTISVIIMHAICCCFRV